MKVIVFVQYYYIITLLAICQTLNSLWHFEMDHMVQNTGLCWAGSFKALLPQFATDFSQIYEDIGYHGENRQSAKF